MARVEPTLVMIAVLGAGAPAAIHAEDVPPPDALPAGFLEFLGEMVEVNGELVDPLDLAGSTDDAGGETDPSGSGDPDSHAAAHAAAAAERSVPSGTGRIEEDAQ